MPGYVPMRQTPRFATATAGARGSAGAVSLIALLRPARPQRSRLAYLQGRAEASSHSLLGRWRLEEGLGSASHPPAPCGGVVTPPMWRRNPISESGVVCWLSTYGSPPSSANESSTVTRLTG